MLFQWQVSDACVSLPSELFIPTNITRLRFSIHLNIARGNSIDRWRSSLSRSALINANKNPRTRSKDGGQATTSNQYDSVNLSHWLNGSQSPEGSRSQLPRPRIYTLGWNSEIAQARDWREVRRPSRPPRCRGGSCGSENPCTAE